MRVRDCIFSALLCLALAVSSAWFLGHKGRTQSSLASRVTSPPSAANIGTREYMPHVLVSSSAKRKEDLAGSSRPIVIANPDQTPAWAIRLGHEFWKLSKDNSTSSENQSNLEIG